MFYIFKKMSGWNIRDRWGEFNIGEECNEQRELRDIDQMGSTKQEVKYVCNFKTRGEWRATIRVIREEDRVDDVKGMKEQSACNNLTRLTSFERFIYERERER